MKIGLLEVSSSCRQEDAGSYCIIRRSVAIFTLAEIKTVVEGFDDGEASVFDALDTIVATVAAYQANQSRREAAWRAVDQRPPRPQE
jgi:hypothetical protein